MFIEENDPVLDLRLGKVCEHLSSSFEDEIGVNEITIRYLVGA